MEKQEHEYRPFPGPVRTRAVAAARRRQLAGTCVQVCRRRAVLRPARRRRSEEHTSELQSLMRISYAVFCLKKKKTTITAHPPAFLIQTRKLKSTIKKYLHYIENRIPTSTSIK